MGLIVIGVILICGILGVIFSPEEKEFRARNRAVRKKRKEYKFDAKLL